MLNIVLKKSIIKYFLFKNKTITPLNNFMYIHEQFFYLTANLRDNM